MNELELTPLTAEEQIFSKLVAKGYPGTTAYRKAYPEKSHLQYNTIRTYASELLTNPNIVTEVTTSKERASRMVRLAEERIEDILINDLSDTKGSKVADVAMFMYEQGNGKATQKVQHTGAFVSVNYNLSGKEEAIPQEIIDQLKDQEE